MTLINDSIICPHCKHDYGLDLSIDIMSSELDTEGGGLLVCPECKKKFRWFYRIAYDFGTSKNLEPYK